MIDVRGGILAVTICLVIALINDKPPPPLPQNAPLCMQPYFNVWGDLIAREMVPCADLNRTEFA